MTSNSANFWCPTHYFSKSCPCPKPANFHGMKSRTASPFRLHWCIPFVFTYLLPFMLLLMHLLLQCHMVSRIVGISYFIDDLDLHEVANRRHLRILEKLPGRGIPFKKIRRDNLRILAPNILHIDTCPIRKYNVRVRIRYRQTHTKRQRGRFKDTEKM